MGGLGKTTLANRVFDNQRVKTYFQSHVWITVSQSYEVEDILRDMIEQLHGEIEQPTPQGMESVNSMRLKQIVKGFLQQKRYVIVLDDVWNSKALEEGFVEKREGMTQEEVGQRYLKELINRSLVQIAKTTIDGRLESCRVHDLMHECILSKARDENFVSFASEQKVELHERVRRLSIAYTYNNSLKQLNLPTLHSLLIFESATSSSLDEQFVPSGCRLLRVLDLGDSPLHKFPQQILVIFHLKYLSLRRTKVRIIPRSIGKLQNLETLDLKQTLVSKLPVEVTKLKKLQYLLVYSYVAFTPSRPFRSITGFLAPQGIGTLVSLQKLCYVKAGGHRNKNAMQELGELCQLRRLGVMDLKKDDAKELCHSLTKMTDLRSLEVVAESEYEVIDLDFLSSPTQLLQRLYIKGCLKKLPHWLPLLNNLTNVRLKLSRLKSSPLVAFQNLPNLVELLLDNAFDGEKLVFGDRGFPKLKELRLLDLQNLRFVLMNGQAMPCLQSLSIYRCRCFYVFAEVQKRKKLRKLWISACAAVHNSRSLEFLCVFRRINLG
ncbi:disease resistance protein RPM1-like [Eucalyptus grandis]|uniref:disease resistance protein RPM1-like n=1 Tax=Eucalyptus grandis TaxID=71139 RepID=UPI00192E89C0|nr:disease resistance protein RPM1-like [Eucalyptus grandis]